MNARLLLAVLLGVPAAGAQQAQALVGDDPVAAERAVRDLLVAERTDVPEEPLVRMLRHHDTGPVLRALRVLLHHGLGEDAVATLADHADPGVRRRAVPGLVTGDLEEILASDAGVDLRRAALHELEDRGALDRETLRRALADRDPALADAAGDLVARERVPLPGELFATVGTEPRARRALLRALARMRRPDAQGFLETWWKGGVLDAGDRIWCLAALPSASLDRERGEHVLTRAADGAPGVQEAVYLASLGFDRAVADSLAGEVLRRIDGGADADPLLACLGNAGPEGERRLIEGLERLAPDARADVVAWLDQRDSAVLRRHVAGALDGDRPLHGWMLAKAGPLLRDAPGRVERVLEFLADPVADRDHRDRAFTALLQAGVCTRAMLEYARESGSGQQVRRLLSVGVEDLPEDVLFDLLGHPEAAVRKSVLTTLRRAPMSERVEAAVLAVVLESAPRGLERDGEALAAIGTIAASGSEAAVRRLWNHLRPRPELHAALAERMIRQPKPWVHPLFLAEFDEQEGRETDAAAGALSEWLELGLARLGDRHHFDALVAGAGSRSERFLRMARSFVPERLEPRHLEQLRRTLREGERPPAEIRAAIVAWLVERPGPATDLLDEVRRHDPSPEVRERALQGLMSGPRRDDFFTRLEAVLGERPLRGERRDLAYRVVNACTPPLDEREQLLLARLLLVGPLGDPQRELELGRRFAGARGGFPLLSAAVHALRLDPECRPEEAFAAAAREARAHPDFRCLARARLSNLLVLVAIDESLARDVAPVVARLLTELPGEGPGDTVARWVLADRLAAAGEWQAAAGQARVAARALLRGGADRWLQRAYVEDGHPTRRRARAAVAARPHLLLARAARQRGDGDEVARQLELAAILGSGDDDTLAVVRHLQQEGR